MKKILNLALGVCALAVTSLSATPEASATTWSASIPYNSTIYFVDAAVGARITTGTTTSVYRTYATSGNPHTGGYYIQCVNQSLAGLPIGGLQTWYGSGQRFYYGCPGGNYVSSSYGWVSDNDYTG